MNIYAFAQTENNLSSSSNFLVVTSNFLMYSGWLLVFMSWAPFLIMAIIFAINQMNKGKFDFKQYLRKLGIWGCLPLYLGLIAVFLGFIVSIF